MSGSRCQRRGQGRTPSFGGPPRVAMVSVCGAQPGVGALVFFLFRETYGVGSQGENDCRTRLLSSLTMSHVKWCIVIHGVFVSNWGCVRSLSKPSLWHHAPRPRLRRSGKKSPPPAMATQQTTPKKAYVSRREQKKIEEAATQAVNAVANVVDVAVEKEIEYVAGKFRQNRELLFTVSSLLKSDSLQALLDGRAMQLKKETEGGEAETPTKPGRQLTLRRTTKKWKHLEKQVKVQRAILKALEPSLFQGGRFSFYR